MAAGADHPAALVVLMGAGSIAQAPFEPASAAAMPSVVGEEDVPRANALLAATTSTVAGMVSLVGVGIVDVASYPLSVELDAGAAGYGAMTALLGGGGVAGAMVAGRVAGKTPAALLVVGFAAGAAGLGLAGAAPAIAIALLGMGVAGIGRGLGDVASVTLIQALSPDEVRSRVFAAHDGAAHVAFSASAFTGGLLVELGGARGAFATATAFGVTAAGIAARVRTG
jgi:MFS family permease